MAYVKVEVRNTHKDFNFERGGIVWPASRTRKAAIHSDLLPEIRACRFLRVTVIDEDPEADKPQRELEVHQSGCAELADGNWLVHSDCPLEHVISSEAQQAAHGADVASTPLDTEPSVSGNDEEE